MAIEFKDFTAVEKLEAMKPRVIPAVKALAEEQALELESYMKRNRPWTDRTNRAKLGLSATVSQPSEMKFRITLAHGVTYGKWLEHAHEKKYAIIDPTIKTKGKETYKVFQDFMGKVMQ